MEWSINLEALVYGLGTGNLIKDTILAIRIYRLLYRKPEQYNIAGKPVSKKEVRDYLIKNIILKRRITK